MLGPWLLATRKRGEIRALRLLCGCRKDWAKAGWEEVEGVRGGFFIHFYDHVDKVSSVPSLLGNTATLSWIELWNWEVRYSYYNSPASVLLCAFVNKQPVSVCHSLRESRLKDCFNWTINCGTEIIRRPLIGLLNCYNHVGDILVSVRSSDTWWW